MNEFPLATIACVIFYFPILCVLLFYLTRLTIADYSSTLHCGSLAASTSAALPAASSALTRVKYRRAVAVSPVACSVTVISFKRQSSSYTHTQSQIIIFILSIRREFSQKDTEKKIRTHHHGPRG